MLTHLCLDQFVRGFVKKKPISRLKPRIGKEIQLMNLKSVRHIPKSGGALDDELEWGILGWRVFAERTFMAGKVIEQCELLPVNYRSDLPALENQIDEVTG